MNGAYFNGVDSKVIVPEQNNEFNIDGDFIVYVEFDWKGGAGYLASKFNYPTAGWYLTASNQAARWGVFDGNNHLVTIYEDFSGEHIFVGKFTNGTLKLFVDGQLRGELNDVPIPVATTNQLRIGCKSYADESMKGIIRKSVIWETDIPDSIIKQGLDAMLKYASPNLYYDFTSGTALDFSGNGYHGQAENVKFIGGKSLSGLYLDGTTTYIECPFVPLNTNKFSVAMDIDIQKTSDTKWFALQPSANNNSSHIIFRSFSRYLDLVIKSGGTSYYLTYYHGAEHFNGRVIFTIDGNTRKLFVNNTLALSKMDTPTIIEEFNFMSIGAWYPYGGPTGFSRGIIKEFRLYNRPILDKEVDEIEQIAPAVFYSFPSGSACDFSGNGNHGIIHGNVKFI